MTSRPTSLLADTDIFIDYLNGVEHIRAILDSPHHKIYYSIVARKELLAKTNLSSREKSRIQMLLMRHRLTRIDDQIAERFSYLLAKYAKDGLRKADALVAATAWSRKLPLLTRNVRHYRFISEITLLDPRTLLPLRPLPPNS